MTKILDPSFFTSDLGLIVELKNVYIATEVNTKYEHNLLIKYVDYNCFLNNKFHTLLVPSTILKKKLTPFCLGSG